MPRFDEDNGLSLADLLAFAQSGAAPAPDGREDSPAVPEEPSKQPDVPAEVPEEPEAQPEEPATAPGASADEPEGSAGSPEEPAVQLEGSAIEPEAPMAASEEPAIAPEATSAQPEAPAILPEEPPTQPKALSAVPEEPAIPAEKPAARKELPASFDVPAPLSEKSAVSSKEPTVLLENLARLLEAPAEPQEKPAAEPASSGAARAKHAADSTPSTQRIVEETARDIKRRIAASAAAPIAPVEARAAESSREGAARDAQPQIAATASEAAKAAERLREGLHEGDEAEKARRSAMRTLKIGIGAAVAVMGLICTVGLLGGLTAFVGGSPADGATSQVSAAQDAPSSSTSGSRNQGKATDSAAKPKQENLSGEVVYRYTTSQGGEGEQSVTETVAFGRDGLCTTSTLEAQFADEEAAASFVESLRNDYGSALKEAATDGANAKVTVDVSPNKLDREAYEDTLRISVEDLMIVKKS